MTSIIEQLQDLSWRGLAVPFTGERTFGFQQEQAQHRFVFRDQQLIESLGRQNPTFSYTIPFRENIQRPPWLNLFTRVYPEFIASCQDRTAGDLIDPVHGTIRAKCVSLQETLSVNAKDGVDVVVEFVYAPDEAETEPLLFAQVPDTLEGLAVQAVRFGANVGELSDEAKATLAELNKPGEKAKQSIANAARQATGFVQQSKNKVRANLYEAGSQMNTTRSELEQAQDPELEPLRRDASRTALAAKNLSETAGDPVTPWEAILVASEIGRMAFATAHGLTIDVLLDFNPKLANVFLIPAGTRVKVPKNSGR